MRIISPSGNFLSSTTARASFCLLSSLTSPAFLSKMTPKSLGQLMKGVQEQSLPGVQCRQLSPWQGQFFPGVQKSARSGGRAGQLRPGVHAQFLPGTQGQFTPGVQAQSLPGVHGQSLPGVQHTLPSLVLGA
jgi:hypothetical protein